MEENTGKGLYILNKGSESEAKKLDLDFSKSLKASLSNLTRDKDRKIDGIRKVGQKNNSDE